MLSFLVTFRMVRFSFMCFYLLVPIFAICQFLNAVIYCDFKTGVRQRENSKKGGLFFFFLNKKPLQNLFFFPNAYVLGFSWLLCFPLLSLFSFWMYTSIAVVA